jgi:hypothetical protein
MPLKFTVIGEEEQVKRGGASFGWEGGTQNKGKKTGRVVKY